MANRYTRIFDAGWLFCFPKQLTESEDFDDLGFLLYDSVRVATAGNPLQPISRPCSIEKYPSSRMANRYARIFDVGS